MRRTENEWEMNILLFADDAVLVAESGERERMLLREVVRECVFKGLKTNSEKSEMMRI